MVSVDVDVDVLTFEPLDKVAVDKAEAKEGAPVFHCSVGGEGSAGCIWPLQQEGVEFL
jgi:hypothetical protein